MNEYKITYSTREGDSWHIVIERSEAAARRAFKVDRKGAEITDIELVNTDVPATKAQEREALEKIKAMIKELGPQSYLKTAFEGVFEDAEENIEFDTAFSMKRRYESSEEKLREMVDNYTTAKQDATDLEEQLKKTQEQIKAANERIMSLERRQISEGLRRDLLAMVTTEAEASRTRMAKSADMIVVCSDNPDCVGFVESVADYRKEKQRAEAMEKRAAELNAMEPEAKRPLRESSGGVLLPA